MYEKLLPSDDKWIFYTDINKVELFNEIHTKTSGPIAKLELKYEVR